MKLKKGVSMVILAVTVVVMAILATTAIVYLEDTGIINKSKSAVKDTNLIQVTELAKTAWNKANSKLDPTLADLQQAVNDSLVINKVNTAEYNVIVTMEGVYVSRDFTAPLITSSSMAYTNNTATVNLSIGKVDKNDYPLSVEYYIKPATITSEEAYSLKKTVIVSSGTESSYTYTGLKQGTEYNIKAVVRDTNGNPANTTLNVTTSGETETDTTLTPTLGSLITAENYGDTVDYSVTVDGTTYDDWQIYYHNEDYVYLITKEAAGGLFLDKTITIASLGEDELALYEKFMVGSANKFILVDTINSEAAVNCQSVARLIRDYAEFANKTDYSSNVVGAIGGPTIELLVAGWNAKGYTPQLSLTTGTYGYQINGENYAEELTSDGLYVWEDNYYWLTSPANNGIIDVMNVGCGEIFYDDSEHAYNVRPVVCLKASIPATVGTGDYDFNLVTE